MKTHTGPVALTEYILKQSGQKADKKAVTLLIQGILAGMYIAIGAVGYLKLAAGLSDPGLGNFLGAVVFPMGIVAVLLMQAELYTSDSMIMLAVYTGRIKLGKIMKVLVLVLVSNLIGGLLTAWMTGTSGILDGKTMELVMSKAVHKVHLPLGRMLVSSILCNIIVSTGVCLAYSCKEEISKIIALWLAITVFVLTGTEHVVANMYYLFAAYFGGAEISLLQILYSLCVSAVGNFIGGGIVVSGMNYLLIRKEAGREEQ
ncbi:formate/nitrite transporter [Anaerotaenia torta]|uniref:formate/nitrite transporter family protein n=1 Tax=Anaerotaenia torta TaxID=433293 RepID=UPI003D223C49